MFFFIDLIMIAPLFFMENLSVEDIKDTGFLVYLGITILIISLFAWIYLGTYYKIENGYLHHRSGPFFGKMKISSIRKIEYHSGWYVPVLYRPATNTVGVIITYNKFDNIYFSPQNINEFIAELKFINLEIELINLYK